MGASPPASSACRAASVSGRPAAQRVVSAQCDRASELDGGGGGPSVGVAGRAAGGRGAACRGAECSACGGAPRAGGAPAFACAAGACPGSRAWVAGPPGPPVPRPPAAAQPGAACRPFWGGGRGAAEAAQAVPGPTPASPTLGPPSCKPPYGWYPPWSASGAGDALGAGPAAVLWGWGRDAAATKRAGGSRAVDRRRAEPRPPRECPRNWVCGRVGGVRLGGRRQAGGRAWTQGRPTPALRAGHPGRRGASRPPLRAPAWPDSPHPS